MKSIFLALFLCSTALNAHASARDWNCWEEVDVTVCKNHQTGQIVRKSVDPSGVITYRDNYGQIVKAYQDQYGATRYRDAYNQEFDPFYEPPQHSRSYYQPPKKEKYTDKREGACGLHEQSKSLVWGFISFLCKTRNISFYSFLSHSFIHSFTNTVSPEGSPGS